MAEKYVPTVFKWEGSIEGPLVLEKGFVLVKKGFLGRIKACVVDLKKDIEVGSYRTITRNLEELSDRDVLVLIRYFEERRMAKQVQLLETELAYRKKLLLNEKTPRPKLLKTVIKYNIKKKDNKIKRYKANINVKKPKKDFIILSTVKRELDEINFESLEFKIIPKFRIIDPKKYVKSLDKKSLSEIDLFEKIYKDLLKLVKNYIESSDRLSKKEKGVNYKFTLGEDLFSDLEFYNQVILLGYKYGIEFDSMPLIYSKKKNYELELEKHGLSEEQVTRVVHRVSTLEEEKNKNELQKKTRLIQQFNELGILCDEFGNLDPVDRSTIVDLRNLDDNGENISIFNLSNEEIIELSRLHTQVKKR